MNLDRSVATMVISLIGAVPILSTGLAEEVPRLFSDASEARRTSVRAEAIRLIREDAEKVAPQSDNATDSDLPDTVPEGVLRLDPLIVMSDKEIPDFTPPRESSMAKFFRTGTISKHVGKKTTTRLWSSGDAGVVLTFSR
jgi:hypothetical protein